MGSLTFFRKAMACALLAGASAACAQSGGAVNSSNAVGVNAPVMTKQGLVQGTAGKEAGITVFKGIPFAAAPVGELRWKQPQPAQPWEGVRDASKWGKACYQPAAPNRFPVNGATDMPDSPGISEDCLFLNIWTPAKAAGEKLPVMVWLYGGAYNEGGGNAPFSEGDKLAKKGVVMVTLNYRVGPFGFLSHPELTAEGGGASGNQAMGDAIAAFKWLKDNVASFGGDPNNITLFGESAGAALNAGLTGAQGARGTFERAIAQSGAWMGLGIATMPTLADMEKRTVEAATKAGVTSLAQMRAMSPEDVQKNFRGQGMVVDGKIIQEDLSITFANGRQNPVDVLVGSNSDEGSFTAAMGGPTATLASWQQGEAQRWGQNFVELGRAAYPATTDAEAAKQATMPFSDAMAWHMRLFAEQQAKIGKQSWLYWFTHEPLYDPDRADLGAGHTAEIPYVFNNLAAPRTFPAGSSVELMKNNPRELAFADQVSQYWVNFARTGNPNGEGLPKWPAVTELGKTEAMLLDADGSGKGSWLTDAQNRLYAAQYQERVAKPLGITK